MGLSACVLYVLEITMFLLVKMGCLEGGVPVIDIVGLYELQQDAERDAEKLNNEPDLTRKQYEFEVLLLPEKPGVIAEEYREALDPTRGNEEGKKAGAIDLNKLTSPALDRLIAEVRNERIGSKRTYDRFHHRHNR